MDTTRPQMHLWQISASLQPLFGGHRNKAFRTVGLAQNLVFKTTRRTEAAMRWLEAVQNEATGAGFRVPLPIPSRNGSLIEAGWTCEPFLAGRAFTPDEMPLIAPFIDPFHTRLSDYPQRPGFLSATALAQHGKGGDVDLAAMPPRLAEICRHVWAGLAPTTVVHGDLNPSNLIRCETGEIGLIDWDECRVDAPIFDIGQVSQPLSKQEALALRSWEAACSWQLEPAYARGLLEGIYHLAEGL